ncbi:hypothetical protein AB833_17880 [Chromatiales bacterium (ex Bugula neritina AB1)]|nr:hypothetical protein AB833_17880 [Chromatiales bacterium (ex Bugula neritina AB1)]
MKVSLAHTGNLLSQSVYDEAFLRYSDGYCVFDQNGILSAFSSNFPQLYPSLAKDITPGISFREYLRRFYLHQAIQNLPRITDLDAWLDDQCQLLGEPNYSYYHHLHDGRSIEIRYHKVSSGESMFIAFDVTTLRKQQDEIHTSQANFYSFAALACDWFWELDKNLCYRYHSTHRAPPSGIDCSSIIGQSRIDSMVHRVVHDDEFDQHNQALLNHQTLDVTLTWLNDNDRKIYSRIKAEPRFTRHGIFTGYFGGGTDVTEQMLLREQLVRHAQYDYITKLLTKRAFETALNESLSKCRTRKMQFVLCMIDLDKFKEVNDQSGHAAGDELLKQLGPLIKNHFSENSIIGRVGGDEFAAIIDCNIEEGLKLTGQLISTLTSTPFKWKERAHRISASAGIISLDGSKTALEMMSHADEACYLAKQTGRGRVVNYHEQDRNPVAIERINSTPASTTKKSTQLATTSAAGPTAKRQPLVALIMDYLSNEKLATAKVIQNKLKSFRIGSFITVVEQPLPGSPENTAVFPSHPETLNVNAVIAFASGLGNNLTLPEFRAVIDQYRHVPIVSIGAALEDVTTVAADNQQSIRDLMHHLISNLHRRRFAFLRSCDHDIDSIEREQVFRDVLAENALPVVEERILSASVFCSNSYQTTSDLLKSDRNIDAIICSDNSVAASVVNALYDLELRVPEDVVVSGFDNGVDSNECTPNLTAARINPETLADNVTSAIVRRLETPLNQNADNTIRIPAEVSVYPTTHDLTYPAQSPPLELERELFDNPQGACMAITSQLILLQSSQKAVNSVDIPWTRLLNKALQSGDENFLNQLKTVCIDNGGISYCNSLRETRSALNRLYISMGNTSTVLPGFTQIALALQHLDTLIENYDSKATQERQRTENFHENFSRQLSKCRSAGSLPDFIDSSFASAGINNAFLVLYPDGNRGDSDRANLQLAYARVDGKRQLTRDKSFPGKQILPQQYHPILCNNNLVLTTLHSTDVQYGYLLVSNNNCNALQLRSISSNISNMLHNINRIREKELHTTELQEINRELAERSNYDSTTGLPNRSLFVHQIDQAIVNSEQQPAPIPVILIGIGENGILDNPYHRQDSHYLFRAMAIRLADEFDSTKLIARVGEREFAIISHHNISVEEATQLAQKAVEIVNAPYLMKGRQICVNASAGIAHYPVHGTNAEELLGNAYTALRHSINSTVYSCCVFTQEMTTSAINKWQLEQDMR